MFASSGHRADDLRFDLWLNLLPDQMSEQSEPLVGGQGEDGLMEGPFVVLAQMRPLQSLYNTVINVVHHTSRGQLAISWSDKDIWKAKEVVNTSIPISIPATGLVMEFVDQAFKIWILLSVSGHEEEEDGVGGGHYYTPH